jgi:Ribosomal protein L14p/L23e
MEGLSGTLSVPRDVSSVHLDRFNQVESDTQYFARFDDNAAVLLNNKREMLGTRIGGVVSADLRMRGWSKIVSLAPKASAINFAGRLVYLV